MVSDTSNHSRCSPYPLFREQTRMIRTEVVEGAHQIHTRVQAFLGARQVAGASGKASKMCAKGSVQPLDKGGVEYSPTLRLLYQGSELLLSALRQSPAHFQAHTFASL